MLVEGLTALAPDIPVLSEEAADIPLETRSEWQRWWLVDPLDGTKEFIAGSDEFTVNVALIEQGRVVFGVVGIPASGRRYYGGAGLGAWQQDVGGAAQAIRVRPQPAEAFTLVASKRHSSPAQERLLAGLGERFGELSLANIGSSLKFCLLAEGRRIATRAWRRRPSGTRQQPRACWRGWWRGAGSGGCAAGLRGAGILPQSLLPGPAGAGRMARRTAGAGPRAGVSQLPEPGGPGGVPPKPTRLSSVSQDQSSMSLNRSSRA